MEEGLDEMSGDNKDTIESTMKVEITTINKSTFPISTFEGTLTESQLLSDDAVACYLLTFLEQNLQGVHITQPTQPLIFQ